MTEAKANDLLGQQLKDMILGMKYKKTSGSGGAVKSRSADAEPLLNNLDCYSSDDNSSQPYKPPNNMRNNKGYTTNISHNENNASERLGAIPKRNRNYKGNPNIIPRNNRSKSNDFDDSNRYQRFGRNWLPAKEGRLRRRDSAESLGRASAFSEGHIPRKTKGAGEYFRIPRTEYPFYVSVPENPSQENLLPPGLYLVIPQVNTVSAPLKLYHHPSLSQGFNVGPEKANGASSKRHNKNMKESNLQDVNLDHPGQSGGKGGKKKARGKEPCVEDDDEPKWIPEFVKIVRENVEQTFDKNEWNGIDKLKSISPEAEALASRICDIGTKLSTQLAHMPKKDIIDKSLELAMTTDDQVDKFIDEERVRINVEKQFNNLQLLLPDEDPAELHAYSQLHKGDERAVREFIDKMTEERRMRLEDEKKAEVFDILPDADPAFLEGIIREYDGNWDSLNEYVFNLLETGNYPKVKNKDAKAVKNEKLWKKYVTDFSVESYLLEVPNPQEYLSDLPNKKNTYSLDVVTEFLLSRYEADEDYLLDVFDRENHNLSRTCMSLDSEGIYDNTIPKFLLNQDINEFFLQEATFIVNRREILRYINNKDEQKFLEREQLREDNTLLKCECCFDEDLVPSDVVTCPEGHIFCSYCIAKYVEVEFGSGIYNYICINESCEEIYEMRVLEKILKKSLLEQIMQKKALEEVDRAEIVGLEKCPSCYYCCIPSPNDKIFKCKNKECLRETCRLCKEENHIPLSCKEIERPKDLEARKRIEEAMSAALIRSCPNCANKIVRADGCNKMTCSCGTSFCYLCRTILRGYEHFGRYGGSVCPTYSSNSELHVDGVRRAGLDMRNRVLQENPDINIHNDPIENF